MNAYEQPDEPMFNRRDYELSCEETLEAVTRDVSNETGDTQQGETPWKASSGHPSGWRVTRWSRRGVFRLLQEHNAKNGRLVIYKSMESAQRAASNLNSQQSDAATN